MPGSERLDPQCGPIATLWQAYANALDGLAKGCEPAAVGIGRWQLELAALTLRRTQAWLEAPARLGRCRTAPDLLAEQARFWQTAGAHYAEGSQRLLATLVSAGPGAPGRAGRDAASRRDFMAVAAAAAAPAKDRRAA
jgi:hypothetical protein